MTQKEPERRGSELMVLAALEPGDVITVDQLLGRLPQLTFGELFLALDALSRRGEVRMRRRGFEYEVSMPGRPV